VKRLRVALLVMECHSVVWNRGGVAESEDALGVFFPEPSETG